MTIHKSSDKLVYKKNHRVPRWIAPCIPNTKYQILNTRNRGFTLVGVLVAVIIGAQVIILITQLMARSEIVLDIGRETVTATGLTREGLELVRARRDQNWFTRDTKEEWLAGLCPDTETNNHQFTIDTAMVRTESEVGDVGFPELFIAPNGLWGHAVEGRSILTPYKRVISIDCSTADEELQHITVTSEVTWQGRQEGERSVVLKEKLYNWIPE